MTSRGLKETPETLNEALRAVLESMVPTAYEPAASGLTNAEQDVLLEGGIRLDRTAGPDPMAETVAKYAAIVVRSLSSKSASQRLGVAPSRIRQMVADRSLYSFLLGGTRHIPDFQFSDAGLVPSIAMVNKALDPSAASGGGLQLVSHAQCRSFPGGGCGSNRVTTCLAQCRVRTGHTAADCDRFVAFAVAFSLPNLPPGPARLTRISGLRRAVCLRVI